VKKKGGGGLPINTKVLNISSCLSNWFEYFIRVHPMWRWSSTWWLCSGTAIWTIPLPISWKEHILRVNTVRHQTRQNHWSSMQIDVTLFRFKFSHNINLLQDDVTTPKSI